MCACFEILGFQAFTLLACFAAAVGGRRRFGTACPSHIQGSPGPRMDCIALEDGTDMLSRNACKIYTPTPRSIREDGKPVCLL
jgi:hypothetical protein